METFLHLGHSSDQPTLEKKPFHATEASRLEEKKMLQAMLANDSSSWGTFEGLIKMHRQLGSDLLRDPELVSLARSLMAE